MNAQTINALEIVMVILYTLSRLSASVAVVYFLCNADITNGWKVFLIALAIIIGLGFNVKYKNPNAQCGNHDFPVFNGILEYLLICPQICPLI